MDGEGRNDVAPFMIYYDTNFTSRAPKLPTSLSISGIKFLNCGSSSRDPNDTTTVYIGGAIYLDSYDTSNVNLSIHNTTFSSLSFSILPLTYSRSPFTKCRHHQLCI